MNGWELGLQSNCLYLAPALCMYLSELLDHSKSIFFSIKQGQQSCLPCNAFEGLNGIILINTKYSTKNKVSPKKCELRCYRLYPRSVITSHVTVAHYLSYVHSLILTHGIFY